MVPFPVRLRRDHHFYSLHINSFGAKTSILIHSQIPVTYSSISCDNISKPPAATVLLSLRRRSPPQPSVSPSGFNSKLPPPL